MKPVSAEQADHPEGEGGIELEGYPVARKLETFGGVVEVA
jgi:hypothetical protein